ncbi:hypothetical protein N7470_003394 [Penicillium chermesinum]|nr:hypothetical protein N7470_003394 [Penicillium chermesinum]
MAKVQRGKGEGRALESGHTEPIIAESETDSETLKETFRFLGLIHDLQLNGSVTRIHCVQRDKAREDADSESLKPST